MKRQRVNIIVHDLNKPPYPKRYVKSILGVLFSAKIGNKDFNFIHTIERSLHDNTRYIKIYHYETGLLITDVALSIYSYKTDYETFDFKAYMATYIASYFNAYKKQREENSKISSIYKLRKEYTTLPLEEFFENMIWDIFNEKEMEYPINLPYETNLKKRK